jgi:Rrf2 family transcriptional regulator, nitric oxide-sensitive transcriptional repressor
MGFRTIPSGVNLNMDKSIRLSYNRIVFSTTLEYALRAVTFLACNPMEGLTAQRIAAGTQVPDDYLSKVLQQLVRGGVLTSQRGRNGGFQLARPASEISMLTVVNAVEPIVRIDKCPLGLRQHGVRLCPLHKRLDHAFGLVEKAFAETTLEELVVDNKNRESLCAPGLEVLHAV